MQGSREPVDFECADSAESSKHRIEWGIFSKDIEQAK